MSTSKELRVGSELKIKIRLPVALSSSPFTEVAISGRIVCGSKLPGSLFGYQVEMARSGTSWGSFAPPVHSSQLRYTFARHSGTVGRPFP
jgi:hypothetical protein